jgi:hypothetical protein
LTRDDTGVSRLHPRRHNGQRAIIVDAIDAPGMHVEGPDLRRERIVCKVCGLLKVYPTDFYPGNRAMCRACKSKKATERNRQHPEEHRASNQRWRAKKQLEKRKDRIREDIRDLVSLRIREEVPALFADVLAEICDDFDIEDYRRA